MTEILIQGIAEKLRTVYKEGDVAIYSERMEQGAVPPCFFILPLDPSEKRLLGRRYLRSYPFVLLYLPQEGVGENSEMEAVAETLFTLMEIIETSEGAIRGTEARYEIADGTLSFYINFNFTVLKAGEEAQTMGSLSYEIE